MLSRLSSYIAFAPSTSNVISRYAPPTLLPMARIFARSPVISPTHRQYPSIRTIKTSTLHLHSVSPYVRSMTSIQSNPSASHLFANGLQQRAFHASHKREIPGVALGAATAIGTFIKSSYTIACLVAISRFALTLLPLSLISKIKNKGKKKRFILLAPVVDDSVRQFFYKYCRCEKYHVVCNMRYKRSGQHHIREAIYRDVIRDSREAIGLPRELSEGQEFPCDESSYQPMRKMALTSYVVRLLPFPPGSEAARALEKLTDDQKWQLLQLRTWKPVVWFWHKRLKMMNILMWGIILLPIVGFATVALFSLERVPYTGRWRLVMLSPSEEDAISSRLRGSGWYQTVISMLTTAQAPAPGIVPIEDWRWNWVNSVLRRLETGVIEQCDAMSREGRQILPSTMIKEAAEPRSEAPLPPPPTHPLHPRVRVSAVVHGAAPGGTPETGREHLEVGPPYSLLLLENDERNAMTFGFGNDGAGGVVVFSGILDEILNHSQRQEGPETLPGAQPKGPSAQTQTPTSTGIASFVRGILGTRPSPAPPAPIISANPPQAPTDEQTLQLACVLAHELAHLLLSHHLEALSSSTVFVPVAAGLISDLLRTLIFPITMLGGPFLNDAISKTFDVGVNESKALTDVAFSRVQEREADIVSLRILAYAGYDPEAAISYWQNFPKPTCCKESQEEVSEASKTSRPWSFFRGGAHDTDEVRLHALLDELKRWRTHHPKTT